MAPGSNKRSTGTVPKTKPSRKNSVPQEMVAPTRRDLQEHLNVNTNIISHNFIVLRVNVKHFVYVPSLHTLSKHLIYFYAHTHTHTRRGMIFSLRSACYSHNMPIRRLQKYI